MPHLVELTWNLFPYCYCYPSSLWVRVGECFFWYWPTRVVPDKGPLNGCVYLVLLLMHFHDWQWCSQTQVASVSEYVCAFTLFSRSTLILYPVSVNACDTDADSTGLGTAPADPSIIWQTGISVFALYQLCERGMVSLMSPDSGVEFRLFQY